MPHALCAPNVKSCIHSFQSGCQVANLSILSLLRRVFDFRAKARFVTFVEFNETFVVGRYASSQRQCFLEIQYTVCYHVKD